MERVSGLDLCSAAARFKASLSSTPPHTPEPKYLWCCWNRQEPGKSSRAFSASDGRWGVFSESGGLLLEQQSQLDQRKKALGANLLKPSHFLLSFPPLSLCTNLGKLQKRLGRCDLSRVGGVGGDGKLGSQQTGSGAPEN